jgi:hypothetical protein
MEQESIDDWEDFCMRNLKHNTVVVILTICFSFISCDKKPEQPQFREDTIIDYDDGNGEDEQPQIKEATINLVFVVFKTSKYPFEIIYGYSDIMCTAKVQGVLTDTEWNDIPKIIENVINGTYNYMIGVNDTITDAYIKVFGDSKVKILVEKTSEYDNYKIDESKTIYLNFDLFNNIEFYLFDIEQESGRPLVEAIFGAIGEINRLFPIFRDMNNMPLWSQTNA